MKLVVFTSILCQSAAFQLAKTPFVGSRTSSSLCSTTEPSAAVSTSLAKTDLLETAKSLNKKYGCLLIDSSAQETLREAVDKLESLTEAPTDTSEMIGDWTLLCATASASPPAGPVDKIAGIDTSKLPFFNESPIKTIRDTLNKSLKVQQLIKSGDMSDGIDRIDHVLSYHPPDTLSEFMDNLPDAIKSLNINPLQITDSKFVLKHKAEIESVVPVIKTKLTLESVIVNVAGKSQNLDPKGADVLGVNVPFGEFSAGTFDTTYMDDKIRISRSKIGIVDQLRVFVRSELDATAEAVLEAMESDEDLFNERGDEDVSPSDVDDSVSI